MEFLAKAAAVVVSVLASLFGQVEEPITAKAAPASAASRLHSPAIEAPRVSVTVEQKPRQLVIVLRPRTLQPDPQSERFLQWLRQRRTGSKPIAAVPWYAQESEFAPSFSDATDVLRSLLSSSENL